MSTNVKEQAANLNVLAQAMADAGMGKVNTATGIISDEKRTAIDKQPAKVGRFLSADGLYTEMLRKAVDITMVATVQLAVQDDPAYIKMIVADTASKLSKQLEGDKSKETKSTVQSARVRLSEFKVLVGAAWLGYQIDGLVSKETLLSGARALLLDKGVDWLGQADIRTINRKAAMQHAATTVEAQVLRAADAGVKLDDKEMGKLERAANREAANELAINNRAVIIASADVQKAMATGLILTGKQQREIKAAAQLKARDEILADKLAKLPEMARNNWQGMVAYFMGDKQAALMLARAIVEAGEAATK